MGGLSHCSSDYARSLANPFSGPEACVPNYPVLLTRKTRVFARGTFSTGTAGFGFIAADPVNAVANNLNGVIASTPTFAGTTLSSAAAGVAGFSTNSEFTAAQFGETTALLQKRVVSAGLRIRYVGTVFDQGGQVLGFSDPEHNNLFGRTFADIDGELESARLVVSKNNWSTVRYRPFFESDLQLNGDFPATVLVDGSFYMAFLVQAASAGTSLTYEYEFYVNHEISGKNVRSKTASHFDPTGFGAVHAATITSKALMPSQQSTGESEKTFLTTATQYLNEAVSFGQTLWNVGKMAAPLLELL